MGGEVLSGFRPEISYRWRNAVRCLEARKSRLGQRAKIGGLLAWGAYALERNQESMGIEIDLEGFDVVSRGS